MLAQIVLAGVFVPVGQTVEGRQVELLVREILVFRHDAHDVAADVVLENLDDVANAANNRLVVLEFLHKAVPLLHKLDGLVIPEDSKTSNDLVLEELLDLEIQLVIESLLLVLGNTCLEEGQGHEVREPWRVLEVGEGFLATVNFDLLRLLLVFQSKDEFLQRVAALTAELRQQLLGIGQSQTLESSTQIDVVYE